MDREASEADALEQDQPVGEPPAPEHPQIGIEVPEADAIEQSQPAPYDDEELR
ncbi:MAG: hypothetical protein QOG64_863 [Acidimicrobiaceae bacterium]|nr:hypothetical protein [Acidimicrobiaceae bacterium]